GILGQYVAERGEGIAKAEALEELSHAAVEVAAHDVESGRRAVVESSASAYSPRERVVTARALSASASRRRASSSPLDGSGRGVAVVARMRVTTIASKAR